MSKKTEMVAVEAKEVAVGVAEVAETLYAEENDLVVGDRLANEITMLKEQTQQVVLFNSIEIGRRLTEAKKLVKHGQWGKWLKERVSYSQRTANDLMKIYEEYGKSGLAAKSQSIANLGYTQALTLLNLPKESRERFVEENDPKDMTIKELQAKVANLTSEKSAVETQLVQSQRENQKLISEKERAKEKTDAEAEKLSKYIQMLEQQAEVAEKNKQEDVERRLQEAIKEEKEKLAKVEGETVSLREEIKMLQVRQAEAVDAARKAERERAKSEVERKDAEIGRLKARMKEQMEKAAGDAARAQSLYEEEQAKNRLAGDLAKGSYLIEEVLDGYAELMDILMGIRKRDKTQGDELLSDLENSMEKIRRKANIKVVAS